MSTIDVTPAKPALSDGGALATSALAAIFWGTNFEATRIVLEHLSPWTAAADRFAIAAVAILAWLGLSRGIDLQVLKRNWPAFATLGIVGVAGFNAVLFLGMETSSPVTAALIMGTTPLTTSLLDALLQRRKPKTITIIGMAISLIGVAMTVGAFSGTHFASGDLLILAGSVGWALYTIGCRNWVRGAAAIETAAWTMFFGAIGLLVIAFLIESPVQEVLQTTSVTQLVVVYMALVGSVLAYIFWQVGIAVRGPAATSILFNLVPVSALVVAVFFGRVPAPPQLAGVAIAILGVVIASGKVRVPRRQ
ncbi:EamA family transporter [Devosia algicola]|uniref:EamA family transporter n=1 Tax=Devosia algicola TaxID=3026418 RepID=A0ABY7YKE4_9HYPH|nr:EamA family transporter [Devosia algicola]WDR01766.1 EamA family transporter [Devosia algicola]